MGSERALDLQAIDYFWFLARSISLCFSVGMASSWPAFYERVPDLSTDPVCSKAQGCRRDA